MKTMKKEDCAIMLWMNFLCCMGDQTVHGAAPVLSVISDQTVRGAAPVLSVIWEIRLFVVLHQY